MPRRRTRQKRRKTRRRTRRRKQRKRKRRRTQRRRMKGGAPYRDFLEGVPVKLSASGIMRILEGNFDPTSAYSRSPLLAAHFNDLARWRGTVKYSSPNAWGEKHGGSITVSWQFPNNRVEVTYKDHPRPPYVRGGAYWPLFPPDAAGPVSDIEPLGRTHAPQPGG